MVSDGNESRTPETVEVDVGKFGGPIFIGRVEGSAMRDKFKLDEYDKFKSILKDAENMKG